ncbi:terminase large subunit [Arthrobacter phage Auxilium]|uniref:Terminase large subunit, nuclease domain n=2 Tax=Richievirus TaxID=3044803 RepID=A0A3G2KIN1_9CAUD|nr:terminase large subunit [Arthrobacter phage Richie]YP_010655822.1 terminase large subunit [Arthrobacter phage Auxilium]AYN55783.1 terminase large subunit, nuclease domain [Arthrobacter phage Auxilium]AYN58831.1 terminase large subunit, nuclease domain [Arthrobacter phage Richie]
MQDVWLPNPPDGTAICLGFDGSENNDFTAIQAETFDGFSFTPRYGPDRLPTIWNPAEWNDQIPRSEVHAAVDEIFGRYRVERMYCDPQDWRTEIGEWSLAHGDEHVFEWATNRVKAMFEEIKRFEIDLANKRITHDGCPIAAIHMANARKAAKFNQQYVLIKPADHQKIDAAMGRILAHTASSDAREGGWDPSPPKRRRVIVS